MVGGGTTEVVYGSCVAVVGSQGTRGGGATHSWEPAWTVLTMEMLRKYW